QKRGGKGRSGATVKDEDVITNIFISNTHASLLFFSSLGKVYKLKLYKIPLATSQSRGRALINLLPITENEIINEVMLFPEDKAEQPEDLMIMFATSFGNVRKNSIEDFRNIQSNGKIAMKLDEGDSLI